jgi:CheY-like chemotaxis protein
MTRYEKTILVVEDEPNDRTFIEMAFRQIGVTGPIHLLNSGEEAIAYMMGEGPYANRGKYAYPSFIITDLKMPGADGFAVLQHIKSNPDWAIIPTVVLSASADPDDIRTAYLLGASTYHVKPATFLELKRQLKILHDYWMTCQIPEVEVCGRHIRTDSQGKLGQRFRQPVPAPSHQTRANG